MMPKDGWVPTANVTAQHRRLSWRAKGLLVDLLSYPDGYNITFDSLMKEASHAKDPDVEGRDAMRKAMQELERKGYLVHRRVAVKDPAPGAQRWRTETAISDLPIFAGQPGTTAPQYPQDSGPPDLSTSSDQEVFNNTGFNKMNQQQNEAGKSSSAFAGAHAGEVAGSQDLPPELDDLYAAANKLTDDQLRRLLLQFEVKRPSMHRQKRYQAREQLKREKPMVLRGPRSVRELDLLTFKYGLQHYYNPDRLSYGIPAWLRRFPR